MKIVKQIGLAAAIIFLAAACKQEKAEKQLDITVDFENFQAQAGDELSLFSFASMAKIDSVQLEENQESVSFSLPVDSLNSLYFLKVNDESVKGDFLLPQLGKTHTTIKKQEDKETPFTAKTTAEGADYAEFANMMDSMAYHDKNATDLNNAWYANRDKDGNFKSLEVKEELNDLYDKQWEERVNFLHGYVKNNHNPAALYLLNSELRHSYNYDELKEISDKYEEQYKKTNLFQNVNNRLSRLEKVRVGAVAPNFTKPNVDGEEVSLTDFRGKYVLVDFWASWCGPCRAENPNLLKTYNHFKDKGEGFDVLGVSYDFPGQREKWLKAIKDDKLPWTQVSELKGWNDETAKLYVISGIPAPFLLDPEGKIIAKHNVARGEKLDSVLQVHLGK